MSVLLLALAGLALLRPAPVATHAAGVASPFRAPFSNDLTPVRQAAPTVPAIQGVFGSPVTFATHAELAG